MPFICYKNNSIWKYHVYLQKKFHNYKNNSGGNSPARYKGKVFI